jgi:hypothetical protein
MSTFAFEFGPTNPAEEALVEALADPGQIPVFLAAFAQTRVQVPVTELPDGDGHVSFPTFASGGESFISVYTSETAVAAAGRMDQPRIELPAHDLAVMWPAGTSMAINSGAGADIALPPAAIEALTHSADGVADRRIPAGTRVTVGPPLSEPEALLSRLGVAAGEWPAIRALHHALVVFDESDEPPQIMIAVEVAAGASELDAALHALAVAAGSEASLLPLRRQANDPINRWMVKQDAPFYTAG